MGCELTLPIPSLPNPPAHNSHNWPSFLCILSVLYSLISIPQTVSRIEESSVHSSPAPPLDTKVPNLRRSLIILCLRTSILVLQHLGAFFFDSSRPSLIHKNIIQPPQGSHFFNTVNAPTEFCEYSLLSRSYVLPDSSLRFPPASTQFFFLELPDSCRHKNTKKLLLSFSR